MIISAAMWAIRSLVIPANAGIPLFFRKLAHKRDPRVRGGDESGKSQFPPQNPYTNVSLLVVSVGSRPSAGVDSYCTV